ncbi:metallophosphoesterase [Gracilibacillus caseinilyticus]|uniref:Metallophosphoesterase n=1 Tax=Gracilibacillus caseinilyticus TaxID=2932256 RepID=A0ABY4EXA0_9BACI|nr:metallophosphoesterase [Gracilibacillus caseinilyticus]UOQ49044.1 metallophosphoesterase [Gracilibacillus caseinilyticus]
MSELKFIHLTDTHVLREYEGSFLEGLDKINTNPSSQLTKILQFAENNKEQLDFILISGDLVHEGGVGDYQYYKALLEEHTTLPVYLSLGNHDVTAAYWETFHGKTDCNDELFYTEAINGYRLIVLDSSYDKSGTGLVSEEQLTWLKAQLAETTENGSIVVVHHPIDEEQTFGEHSLKNSKELLNVVQNQDEVFAVLSGHIHQNLIEQYPGFISSAAEGSCFGVEFDGVQAHFTNNSAFNVCTIQNKQLKIQVNRVPETNKVLFSYSIDEMTHA